MTNLKFFLQNVKQQFNEMTEEETSNKEDCWHGCARPLFEEGRLLKLALVIFPCPQSEQLPVKQHHLRHTTRRTRHSQEIASTYWKVSSLRKTLADTIEPSTKLFAGKPAVSVPHAGACRGSVSAVLKGADNGIFLHHVQSMKFTKDGDHEIVVSFV